jgi:hypothetical protein
MLHLEKSKKILLLIIIVLVAIVGILFKLSGGILVFSYLKPMYLPSGISIKDARVIATKADVFTELNFRTEDWVYEIQQSQTRSTTLPSAKGNYDAMSINFTCSMFVSPKQRQYRLCHSVDYGKISRYEVTQINGSTLITSAIPTTLNYVIATEDIGKYVDSFKRTPKLFAPTFRHDGP